MIHSFIHVFSRNYCTYSPNLSTGKYITGYNEKSENYKPILTVYSGVFNATAYSAFANSTYNLGTDSSKLIINELANNIIPVGGFPYHLAKRTGDNDLSLGNHSNFFIFIHLVTHWLT